MEYLKAYERLNRSLNVYINKNQMISVQKGNVSWVCEECGSPTNHNNYILEEGHTCECGKIHPNKLCNESDLFCPICGDAIITYHTVDKSGGWTTNGGLKLSYDLHDCRCDQCCGHQKLNNGCPHCNKIMKVKRSCYSHYHCGCEYDDHVFVDDHLCKKCKENGHWTQNCKNVKTITIDDF